MLTQGLFAGELQTSVTNVVYDASAQGLAVMAHMSTGENSQNEGFERVKEAPNRSLEKLTAYTME